ncbi:hypothetical protein IE81DRAFT_188780 [Ceraceosorus guamensis]|uniref:PIN domain-containing protein n=1 Tax=Ceraceosorus guamensis TaxID=1522189 RepID=A0A316WBR3_9BASI|nr:hypothetical protein IE81DRAFT_188780 [Ceraceosorus guamensis]PWN45353.1 hypothetical protein IE81DRAFT_188780 [Ceraceosorus guamensis]
MPTYADLYALAPVSSGPMRLTISRNEHGEEVWEEEELMDCDAGRGDTTDVLTNNQDVDKSLPSGLGLISALASTEGPNIFVIDTNALLDALTLLDALYKAVLAANVNALSTPTARPAPILLVVPSVVLRELDSIKKSNKNASPRAQQASRWILSMVHVQKHMTYFPVPHQEQVIPQAAWALIVQTSSEQREFELAQAAVLSADDHIIQFTKYLQELRKVTAWLFSSDVNCRARAEAEGLRTLSVKDVLGSTALSPASCTLAAAQLLEQWQAQVQTKASLTETAVGADVQMMEDLSNLTVTDPVFSGMVSAASPSPSPSSLPSPARGRSTADSRYASDTPLKNVNSLSASVSTSAPSSTIVSGSPEERGRRSADSRYAASTPASRPEEVGSSKVTATPKPQSGIHPARLALQQAEAKKSSGRSVEVEQMAPPPAFSSTGANLSPLGRRERAFAPGGGAPQRSQQTAPTEAEQPSRAQASSVHPARAAMQRAEAASPSTAPTSARGRGGFSNPQKTGSNTSPVSGPRRWGA